MNDRWFDRAFTAWFVFCAILGLTLVGGVVAGVLYLLPHLVGMMDRIGK